MKRDMHKFLHEFFIICKMKFLLIKKLKISQKVKNNLERGFIVRYGGRRKRNAAGVDVGQWGGVPRVIGSDARGEHTDPTPID